MMKEKELRKKLRKISKENIYLKEIIRGFSQLLKIEWYILLESDNINYLMIIKTYDDELIIINPSNGLYKKIDAPDYIKKEKWIEIFNQFDEYYVIYHSYLPIWIENSLKESRLMD
jgi:hypothetical protein